MKGCKKKVSKGGDMMRKEWKEQKQLLKLGAGACCVSIGYVLWVPFMIADRLGGAKAPFEVRLTGVFLLALGAVLLLWGFRVEDWKEWLKLFLFFGLLQLVLSAASGLFALLVLSLSGENGRAAKEAADLFSMILALFHHAWTLCLIGRLIKKGRFALWFPGRLFLKFLGICSLAALCQLLLGRLPKSTAGILSQGVLGGGLLFTILCLMVKLTEQQLSGEQSQE